MNTEHIIGKEGYRLEDLTAEHQETMRWLRYVEDELRETVPTNILDDEEDDPLHERLYGSIGREVLEEAADFIHATINEIQITLAESEPERGE